MDLYLIKTTQFYLNNLKVKSLTTKLGSRTVFNFQNCQLHPSAPDLRDVVKNNKTPVLWQWDLPTFLVDFSGNGFAFVTKIHSNL